MPIGQLQLSPWNSPTAINPIGEALGAAVNMYYKPQEKSAAINLANAQANQANAMANFTPVNLATTLLSNPTLRDTMPTEQIAALTKYASQGLTNGMNRTNIGPQPSLLQHIMHSLGFGNSGTNQTPSSSNVPSSNNNNVSPSSVSTQNSPAVQSSPNSMPIPQENAGITNNIYEKGRSSSDVPDSTINRVANGIRVAGSQGGNNPAAVAGAQEGALKTTANTEAANQQEQWKIRQDQAARDGQDAAKAMIDDNNILQGYRKLGWYERGPIIGSKKAMTTEATDFDRYASNRSTSLAQALSSGSITEQQFDAGKAMKVSREATPDSVEHAMAFDKGLQVRRQQRAPFQLEAQNAGLTPAQSDILWNRMIQEKPFWNARTSQIIPKNLNYKDYFNPNMIAWAKNPTPIPIQSGIENDQDVRVRRNKDGQTGTIPSSKLQRYLANGYSKI